MYLIKLEWKISREKKKDKIYIISSGYEVCTHANGEYAAKCTIATGYVRRVLSLWKPTVQNFCWVLNLNFHEKSH